MKRKDSDSRRRSTGIARRAFLYGRGAVVVVGALPGSCGRRASGGAAPVTTDAIGDQVQTLARGQLPVFAGAARPGRCTVTRSSTATSSNTCRASAGAVRFGHKSNRDCYIKSFNPEGTLTFTSHAAT